jgi:HAE1 family hydrophobic/amphiphilic exporter-1
VKKTNLSAVFIQRPIATSLMMLGIAVIGLMAYEALPVADLPQVDFPTITVTASLPGADPGTMASTVASPLERQFTTIAGVDSMTSSSGSGNCSITLQFDLGRDIDGAAVDVQSAIAEAMPLLPAGMPAPPSFRKVNPADQPLVGIGLVSSTRPLWEVEDFADSLIVPRLAMVNGVAQVNIFGAQKYAVRVQVDPERLQTLQLGIEEIDTALQNWNVNLPTGQLFGRASTFTIKADGQLLSADAFKSLVVAYRGGVPVRLDQVASVINSVEDNQAYSWFYTPSSEDRSISLLVTKQPGTNAIEVSDRIHALLPVLARQLPPSIHLIPGSDSTLNIRKAFTDIQITMGVTLLLVVAVIFVFLRSARATAIPALALPFSLLGTLAVIKLLHFSLNNLSMMALILSIGFVVDDAIVMLENVTRHLEHGEAPLEAALNGSEEISFTIVTMTVSLAAVFIPILFMQGILGRLFREFAVTITSAILISGVVSVTLTPMLCHRFLRSVNANRAQPWWSRWLEWPFTTMLAGYRVSLGWVLRHRPIMLGVFVAVLAATVYLFQAVPRGFIPDQDNDTLQVNLRAAQGTSYLDMAQYVQQVARIVHKNPNMPRVYLQSNAGNTALIIAYLKPRATRKDSAQVIAQQLRGQLGTFTNFRATVTMPPALTIGGRQSDATYSVVLQDPDTATLYDVATAFERAVEKLPEVRDVSSDVEIRSPRVNLRFDRDRASALGVNVGQIENGLNSSFGPKWSSTIYTNKNQYHVLLELLPKYRDSVDGLRRINFKASSGRLVPFQAVVHFQPDAGPQRINHVGQLPAAAVTFGLRPGVSLGEAVAHIRELGRATLPPAVSLAFEGSARVFESSIRNLSVLLVVAIGVVYIVLGMLYESYIQPITILSGLPSAGLGALVTLILFGSELNVYSFVGLVMLVGIVKKNAIMQIDFALEAERKHGLAPTEAIYEGCVIRFRPIMMTTMAAFLAAIPIAFGYGSGGEARRPLGFSVVGGLVVSQLITLYLTPVVYTYMAIMLKTRRIVNTTPPSVVASRP